MMRLVKGDEDNLEERVIIYSKLKKPDINKENFTGERIIAVYITKNLEDYAERMGISNEDLNNTIEEIEDLIEIDHPELSNHKEMFHYPLPFPVESESDLFTGDENVFDVGTYSSLKRCFRAVRCGVYFYLLMLEEQKEKNKNLISKEDTTKIKFPLKIYSDIKIEDLRRYIIHRYISPMMYMLVINDTDELKRLKEDFVRFSKGSPFERCVGDLCDMIENKQPNISLTEYHIDEIDAICREDYERAAEIRDKIKELRLDNLPPPN